MDPFEWRVWARTASTTGYNSETASIFEESDSSISDSEKSAVGDGNDAEDEKEPGEEAQQNKE
jgi:hypothetical protein